MPDFYANPSAWVSDHDPEAGLILDRRANILVSNAAAKTVCDLTGQADLNAILPVNHQALAEACLHQQRAIEGVESRLPGCTLLWTFIPAMAPGHILARGRNATGEIRKLDEATRSSRLYRLITENTTDLISRHDPEGRFIDATPASWRLLGYWPEELRGKRLEEVFQGKAVAGELEAARTRLRDEGYATMILEIVHRDGTRRWFEIASRAIRETYTGAVVEVISVSRDITARVASEENNRRLADELAHTARLATMGELASGIAHEMNQPLATIINYASASQRYLRQARTSPELLSRVDDGLQRITRHANRAAEVIKRLRAFLRKGQKRTAAIRANEVVSTAMRLCQWHADKHRITLRADLSAADPVVTADPVLLEQVLINLIRNAIEATAEASPAAAPDADLPAITIATSTNLRGEVLIGVTDQGPGLDEAGLRQIFTPFYTSKPQGLGLGLSMSRSIIEGFGGFLDATPAPAGGLVLECRFPPPTTHRHSPESTETTTHD